MDVNFFSPDHDLINQALRYGLALFKRESFEIISQQLAKGLGVVNDLLPVDSLLSGVGQLPDLLFKPLQLGREFLSSRLQLGEVDDLGLIGIEQPLVLSFNLPPAREQL